MTNKLQPSVDELKVVPIFLLLPDTFFDSNIHLFSKKSLKMGEILAGSDNILDSVFFLVNGSLRQHVYHPESQKRLTLAIHNPPFIAGLASYWSDSANEYLSAACDSDLIEINKQDLKDLLCKYSDISFSLEQILSASDLWSLISTPFASRVPGNSQDLQSWINRNLKLSCSQWIKPGSELNFEIDSTSNWIIANHNTDFTYGSFISDNQFIEFP